jgi:hypothetical protein
MTQDEIIEMARQSDIDHHKLWNDDGTNRLEAFAKLVAAKEREACAHIAFNGCLVPPDGGSPTEDERLLCEHIAHTIRAKGEA